MTLESAVVHWSVAFAAQNAGISGPETGKRTVAQYVGPNVADTNAESREMEKISLTDCRDAEHSTESSTQENVEEYLEVMTIMEEVGVNQVKIGAIASHLGITPPSAVQMLRKLSKSGHVSYEPETRRLPYR